MTLSRWIGIALSIVLVPLFVIVVWQLMSLNPEYYCRLVKNEGVPPGDHCYKLLLEGLKIKGWVIWLLIGTLASFVLLAMSFLTKTFINVTCPGGTGLQIGEKNVQQLP